MGPLRIAVAGAETIGQRHVALVLRCSDCQLAAIADPAPGASEIASNAKVSFFSSFKIAENVRSFRHFKLVGPAQAKLSQQTAKPDIGQTRGTIGKLVPRVTLVRRRASTNAVRIARGNTA